MTTDIFSTEPVEAESLFAEVDTKGDIVKDEPKEEKKKEEVKEEAASQDLFSEEVKEEEKKEKEPEEEVKEAEKPQAKKKEEDLSIDYSAVYKKLVKEGKWFPLADKEGNPIEEVELDENSFEELVSNQNEWKYQEYVAEKEQENGELYVQFSKYIKDGGKVEELINSHKEQKDVESIDETTTEGAEEVIKYYCEALNWNEKRTNSYIESLKDRGTEVLQEEAKQAKADLVANIKEERDAMVAQQEQVKNRAKAVKEKFAKDLKETISKSDRPLREQRALEKFYFEPKIKVEGGYITEFQAKMSEISNDPQKLINFIEYAYNPENFKDKTKAMNEAAETVYKKVREGSSLIKKSSREPVQVSDDTKKASPTLFKKYFN